MIKAWQYKQKNRLARWPTAWFMTDENRVPDPIRIVDNLPRHVGVIIRDYNHPQRAKLAHKIIQLCQHQQRPVLIGADVLLAHDTGADGIHLPSWFDEPLTIRKPGWIISCPIHQRKDLYRARHYHANMALISPVFKTPSHPGSKALGLAGLARLMPLNLQACYALGGLGTRNLPPHLSKKLHGYAGISEFLKYGKKD